MSFTEENMTDQRNVDEGPYIKLKGSEEILILGLIL
jgi:hypothetical protein